MLQVRFLKNDNGRHAYAGEVHGFPDPEAKELVRRGVAAPFPLVEAEPEPEPEPEPEAVRERKAEPGTEATSGSDEVEAEPVGDAPAGEETSLKTDQGAAEPVRGALASSRGKRRAG